MPTKKLAEKDYYGYVEKFLKNRFDCFVTAQNRGTKFGRVDVVGIRDIGGEHKGDTEIIGVEVKGGNQPFNTATGQAYGYSVYADRCYLADVRDGARPFTLEEIDIASKLGVGLLAIRPKGSVTEILTSPKHIPLVHMRVQLINKLGYSECMICGSTFERGDDDNWNKYVSREIKRAVKQEKGFVYWLFDIDARKRSLSSRKYVYDRRYVCAECIKNLYGEFVSE
jgi:hypothetical protein